MLVARGSSANRVLDRALECSALYRALAKVHANRGCPGTDGVTTRHFLNNAQSELYELQCAVREGRYATGPLREVLIPKDAGGERRLLIPTVRDRVLQTSIAQSLSPLFELEFESSSFGYRPGRGIQLAARHVREAREAGYTWVVDADIRRFFDQVCHTRLRSNLLDIVPDERLLNLVSDTVRARVHGVMHDYRLGRGVPQGSPLSPMLSNLYLDRFDESFIDAPVRLIRYADDFVVMCRSEAAALSYLDHCRAALARLDLALNMDKTRIGNFDRGFRFLGYVFTNNMVLPPRSRHF